MADITNKNELKRRIELFLDELDYSINEDFCKETMKMMREFIGHANHRLDCEESRVKSLKKKLKEYREIGTVEGYKSAIECYTKEYLLRRNLQDQIKEQYNKAIDDALSVVEWDGYTIDIKERIEQLKRI